VVSSSGLARRHSGFCHGEQVAKIMAIYRALHNHVWIGEGKKTTPAMRLGFADKPCAYSGERDRSFRSNVTAAHEMVLRG
jgi:hypothetical protein